MKSKAKFDLGQNNEPILRLHIAKESDDLRDSVAKQFTQALGGDSCYCLIMCDSLQSNECTIWTVTPIKPEDLKSHGNKMIK